MSLVTAFFALLFLQNVLLVHGWGWDLWWSDSKERPSPISRSLWLGSLLMPVAVLFSVLLKTLLWDPLGLGAWAWISLGPLVWLLHEGFHSLAPSATSQPRFSLHTLLAGPALWVLSQDLTIEASLLVSLGAWLGWLGPFLLLKPFVHRARQTLKSWPELSLWLTVGSVLSLGLAVMELWPGALFDH